MRYTIACDIGQPTEELLQHLLQLDSSQMKKMIDGCCCLTPLGLLYAKCPCNDHLTACLMKVDSSIGVVASGIAGCLESADHSRCLERVEMLLKANPDAVKYRNPVGWNMLHAVLYTHSEEMPTQILITVINRIMVIHKEALRENDSLGWLPIHVASRYSTIEVVEFLLGLYPESSSMVSNDGVNLLHLAICDQESTISVMEAKVRFLCLRYPAMIKQRHNQGFTPLHEAIMREVMSAVPILCETAGQEQAMTQVAHPTNVNFHHNSWLPLHILIYKQNISLRDSLHSKEADCFRMLLRLYPEAAGIEVGISHL